MSEQTTNPQPDPSDENGIELMREIEQQRRVKLIAATVVVLGLFGALAFYLATAETGELAPKMDIAAGEAEVLAKTNDPQCRALILDVTKLGHKWRALEPTISKTLIGDKRADVVSARARLEELRGALKAQHKASAAAALRFDTSRKELTDWFAFIDAEIDHLDTLGKARLEQLDTLKRVTEGEPAVTEVPKAGTDAKADKKAKDARTPSERRDAATLAISESFEGFRVWHASKQHKHPCGAASDGEVGWTPPKPVPQPASQPASQPAQR